MRHRLVGVTYSFKIYNKRTSPMKARTPLTVGEVFTFGDVLSLKLFICLYTRKPCSRRETARCRCKFRSIQSVQAVVCLVWFDAFVLSSIVSTFVTYVIIRRQHVVTLESLVACVWQRTFIHCRYYGRRRPTPGSYHSVAVRGVDGYQLQAPPTVDNCITSGSGYGGKYKNPGEHDGRHRHRDSVMSRDSCSLFYGDGEVDRDGYTHIWERPLPGAPPRHVTTAAMLVPVGGSVLPSDCGSCPESLVYKCRGAAQQGLPPPPLPPPLPVLDSVSPTSCQDAAVTSVGDLSDYYQLDAKDDDQSPLDWRTI